MRIATVSGHYPMGKDAQSNLPGLQNSLNDLVAEQQLQDDYAEFSDVLAEAFDFTARGKGHERHGGNLPWREQPHAKITEDVGLGFPIGQALKKIREGNAMEEWDACRRELLGAIGYLCSAVYNGDRGID